MQLYQKLGGISYDTQLAKIHVAEHCCTRIYDRYIPVHVKYERVGLSLWIPFSKFIVPTYGHVMGMSPLYSTYSRYMYVHGLQYFF